MGLPFFFMNTLFPKVSVVIPTYNRPEMVTRAVRSVLAQSYQNFEIIVVDDGLEKRAEEEVQNIHDERILYIKNEKSLGGGGSRNVGIGLSKGEYIAFLDDDDEWLPEKLKIQMDALVKAPETVGFCFCAVTNVFDDREENTKIEDGIKDYSVISLVRFKGFLTVTLLFPKNVLLEVGGFDTTLPSHQDPELVLRVSQKYKGLGVNQPLVRVNMKSAHDHIGGSLKRRIVGREMVIEKHKDKFVTHKDLLAKHYLWLGLWCRDDGQKEKARGYFWKSFQTDPRFLSLGYFLRSFLP